MSEPEVGTIYTGKVVKVVDFGAFVNFFGAKDGLVHVSQMALERVANPADVVSEGEMRRALAAGIPARKVVFSGVGKTAREMDFALQAGILCFNVESEPELELLSARAVANGKIAPVSLRISAKAP